jgi:hypothetical protein
MKIPLLERRSAIVPLGRMHAWWGAGPLPALPPLPALTIAPCDDTELLGAVAGTDPSELERRVEQGHVAWVARLTEEPVASGWCATREFSIGELGVSCALPPRQRYLWDFFTIPPCRGFGIYPRLLQTIVASEPEVKRFWVGHDFDNVASARGIAKAGFREVGVLYRRPDGAFVFVPSDAPEVALEAAALLGVPAVVALAGDAD